MRTYQHSGVVPALGAMQALAIGSAAAVVLGIAYSFSFYYIPYVYLNFLLAIAFGAGVGWTTGWAAGEGKIRNTPVTVALAVVATVVGIWAEWGSALYAMAPASELGAYWQEFGLATFTPWAIVGLMQELFVNGSWGLTAGQMVNGWTLFALWIIEAGVVIGLAATTAYSQIAKKPFCEACNEWIASESPHFYMGNGYEKAWTDMKHGDFDALADTEQATGSEPTYVKVTLHVCETCTASNYLSVTRCENKIDGKGNQHLVETDLARNLAVDDTQVELIRAAHLIAPVAGMPPLGPPAVEPGTAELDALRAAAPTAAGSGTNWTLQS